MRRVILQREETGDHGTFGHLVVGSRRFLTGELPYRDNRSGVSCIPPSTYRCAFTPSPRFRRKLYILFDVPGRSAIRIHPANYMGASDKGLLCHLHGCIALGYRKAVVGGQKGIFSSLPAVRDFEFEMNGEEFELEIRQ